MARIELPDAAGKPSGDVIAVAADSTVALVTLQVTERNGASVRLTMTRIEALQIAKALIAEVVSE